MAIVEREEFPEIPGASQPVAEIDSNRNHFTRTLIEAIAANSLLSPGNGSAQSLYGFLNAESPDAALKNWRQLCRISTSVELEDCFATISQQIAAIDRLLSAQVNEILHHPRVSSIGGLMERPSAFGG